MDSNNLPLSAIELIPHRSTMLLIDKLLSYDKAQGSGCILAAGREESLFCAPESAGEGRFLEEVVVLEMMAQAYACLRGYEDRLQGCQPSLGFLVGVRHFNLRRRVKVCEEVIIQVATTIQLDDFFIADAVAMVAAEKVATGELKIWLPPTDTGDID